MTEDMDIYYRMLQDTKAISVESIDCNTHVIIGAVTYKIKGGKFWRRGRERVPRYIGKHRRFNTISCSVRARVLSIFLQSKDRVYKYAFII